MYTLDTGGFGKDQTPAIIDTRRTKSVDVSSANFVWDSAEWDGEDLAEGKLRPTEFKLKVSKGCFLKVLHAKNTVPSVHYFQPGENNDVLIRVYADAGNLDEDGSAFTGVTAGTIKAGINY